MQSELSPLGRYIVKGAGVAWRGYTTDIAGGKGGHLQMLAGSQWALEMPLIFSEGKKAPDEASPRCPIGFLSLWVWLESPLCFGS